MATAVACPGGGSPQITVDPTTITFPVENKAGVTVSNSELARGPLKVTSVRILGDSRSAFSLSGLPSLPLTLAPATSFAFTVTYNPPTYGTDAASLFVDSSDPVQPEVKVSMSARLDCAIGCYDAGVVGDGGFDAGTPFCADGAVSTDSGC